MGLPKRAGFGDDTSVVDVAALFMLSVSFLPAELNGPPFAAVVLSVAVTLTVNVPASVGIGNRLLALRRVGLNQPLRSKSLCAS